MQFLFTGAAEVKASRPAVWARLMDPRFVAASAPGVESIEQVDATRYKVHSAFGIGAMKFRFTLELEIGELTEPERATMWARGTGPGSDVAITSGIHLVEAAPGHTIINWKSDNAVNGAIADIGGRLIESAARKVTEEFWLDFARRIDLAVA